MDADLDILKHQLQTTNIRICNLQDELNNKMKDLDALLKRKMALNLMVMELKKR